MNSRYISMAEASRISPYTQEYLSLMARKGSIQAKKIGKKWYTNINAINDHIKKIRPEDIISNDFRENEDGSREQNEKSVGRKRYFDFRFVMIYAAIFLAIIFLIYGQLSSGTSRNDSVKKANPLVVNEKTQEIPHQVSPYFTIGEKTQF